MPLASDGGGQGSTPDSTGQPVDVRSRPAQVIKAFVAENNIDLLVVPVPPPSTLKRLDPRNMRGVLSGHLQLPGRNKRGTFGMPNTVAPVNNEPANY
jgi:hypothetical protein